jgi:hypothetical protein
LLACSTDISNSCREIGASSLAARIGESLLAVTRGWAQISGPKIKITYLCDKTFSH